MTGAIRSAAAGLAIRMMRIGCLGLSMLLASLAKADNCQLGSYGTLPVEIVNGRAIVAAKINGQDTRFIVDTGAFFSIMSNATASSLGLKQRPFPLGYRIVGVGGGQDAKYTTVKDFGFLGGSFNDIDFLVSGTDPGYGLLGANMLDSDDLELDMAHGKITLFKLSGCKNRAMAYWSSGRNYFVADIEPTPDSKDRSTYLRVMLDGKPMLALLDSGAQTMISRDAAERIGIDLNAPGVRKGSVTHGIGGKSIKTWAVPIDSFSVGTETIQHTQMAVLDGNLGNRQIDMLLGLDYLLAHRVFIANSQRKVYFTYNGGRVSFFDGGSSAVDTNAGDAAKAPLNAADYALRGEADLSRGDPKAAVADLNEAIRMAPDQAGYYLARARALWVDRQSDAALTDLNKCLSLDPKNLDALLLRSRLHYSHRDLTSAAADVATASPLAPAGSAQAQSIAAMYIQLDQPASALPLLDEWIRLHPDDARLGMVLNERCWARALSNQMLDDALHDCRNAIKRDGEIAAYLDSLGLVQLRLGRYPDSVKAYQQAIAKSPRSAWSHYGLGLAEIHSGQSDAGHDDIAAARALDRNIDARVGKYGLTATGP